MCKWLAVNWPWGLVIALIVGALIFFGTTADHFKAHCHKLGGISHTLPGRDMHMLCVSRDGRLLDQR